MIKTATKPKIVVQFHRTATWEELALEWRAIATPQMESFQTDLNIDAERLREVGMSKPLGFQVRKSGTWMFTHIGDLCSMIYAIGHAKTVERINDDLYRRYYVWHPAIRALIDMGEGTNGYINMAVLLRELGTAQLLAYYEEHVPGFQRPPAIMLPSLRIALSNMGTYRSYGTGHHGYVCLPHGSCDYVHRGGVLGKVLFGHALHNQGASNVHMALVRGDEQTWIAGLEDEERAIRWNRPWRVPDMAAHSEQRCYYCRTAGNVREDGSCVSCQERYQGWGQG